ncbi:hypothetical protein BJV82DRAFT_668971 [Fennellomyces sp. T-0311]|nr:hypothetical protein BJV82DRAFT_668971 [Fennellomyces sp. T-0311]
MESTPLSTCNSSFEPDSLVQLFTKVTTAVSRQDYVQITEYTAQAIVRIHESLVAMLNHRVYALSMQGKFEEAIKDAQTLIGYEPTLATGYLRLGEMYQMQGKQQNAIDTYNLGLQSALENHPDYTQMVYGKESATKQNEARIDFIAMLPVEIIDNIIALLPAKSTFVWLSVSEVWRARIYRCKSIWKVWRTGNSTNVDWSIATISDIAANVEDLTINTTNYRVFSHYLHSMNDGKFLKLKSLNLDGNATKHIHSGIITPFSRAIWEIHGTLTKLVIKFDQQFSTVISPTDLLLFCPNLKCLEYSTISDLSYLTDELPPLEPHNHLVDLRLTANSITSQDLQKILPGCQQIRRLLLHGCNPTVLDAVSQLCPNIETFGYNAQIDMIPELDERSTPGLRRLYTQNGGAPVPASTILPLIRRNQLSLETLYINVSGGDSPMDLIATYADLELKNLNRLTFWGDDGYIIQPLILRSISTCTTLNRFTIVESRDIAGIAQTLLVLPQLEYLSISYPRCATGEADLIRLFKKYASDPQSGRRLKSISLRHCRTIMTRDVLGALVDISTLKSITLEGASRVSTQGWNAFFKKLGDNILDLRLNQVDAITSSSLIAIGHNLTCLKHIRLEKLDKITGYGITELVEKSPKLESLTLVKCKSVTLDVIELTKKKVRNVVII